MKLFPRNLKFLRKKGNYTQGQLAESLGVGTTTISNYEKGVSEPSIDILLELSKNLGVSIDGLISINLEEENVHPNVHLNVHPSAKKGYKTDNDRPSNVAEAPPARYDKPNVLPIVVDKYNEERIVLVPVAVRAGYLSGFQDPEYIKELPHFSLVGYSGGTFRAFEVEGDSMEPTLLPKDIIVCQYIENPTWVMNGEIYVVHTDTGLVVKRCFFEKRTNKLELVSDNDYISSYKLHAADVREIWRFRCVIRVSLGHSKGTLDARMAKLEARINQLESDKNAK